MQYQLSESQWLAREELERLQFGALAALLRHARETVPYYREIPAYSSLRGIGTLGADDWRRLPILTRETLQAAGLRMRSEALPADHGPVTELMTTGSTGRPVRGLTTRVTRALWSSITLREMLWHDRDFTGKFAAIRADMTSSIPSGGTVNASWGPSVGAVFETGPGMFLSIDHDVATQAEWLSEHDPDYLLTYPSNALALAHHFRATGARLRNLRELSTYGEALSVEVRSACRQAWKVPVVDMYSAQEIGYIALQCPENETYHVQSETVYAEVLDDDGRPCGPGELGRVVITCLHNYATPLLRYEIGDYAVVGDMCSCERGLPVLTRVMGRQRNMWTLPDGRRIWPMFSSPVWAHLEAVRQLQLVQHSLDHIEARIVGPRPLSPDEEVEFEALLRSQFQFPFRLTLTHLDTIDRTSSRKFEDFVSHLPATRTV